MGRTEDEICLRDRHADGYDAWYQERGARAVFVEDSTIIRYLAFTHRDRRFLDAGAGTGRLTYKIAVQFPHLQILALDISRKSLSLLEKKGAPNITTGFCDFSRDRFGDLGVAQFDKILSMQLIQHLDKQGAEHCIRELYSALAPGGTLVCELYNYMGLNRLLERRNGQRNAGKRCREGRFFEYRYSASEFREFVLKHTDFRSVKIFGCQNIPRRFVNKSAVLSRFDLFLSRFPLSACLSYYFVCICKKSSDAASKWQ